MPVRPPHESPIDSLTIPQFRKVRDHINPDRIIYQVTIAHGHTSEIVVHESEATPEMDARVRAFSDDCRRGELDRGSRAIVLMA